MKVIFLDIDGVLNTDSHAKELYKLVEAGKMTEANFYATWDLPYDETALPLKHIVLQTGAKIVLSSSWRALPAEVERLSKKLKEYGLDIWDKTPYGVSIEDLAKAGFDYKNAFDINLLEELNNAKETHDRGAEIAVWLYKHPEVESFVILDDDIEGIQPYYTEQHIRTDFYGSGLTMDLANKAINILKCKERK